MLSLHAMAAMIFAALAAAPLAAQQNAVPRTRVPRVPVIVALVDLARADEPFQIVRRKQGEGSDVILLSESATPAILSAAVRTLMVARVRSGDTARVSARLRLHQNTSSLSPVIPWTVRVLDDLRRAPAEGFGEFGTARRVQIWLPRTHRPAETV